MSEHPRRQPPAEQSNGAPPPYPQPPVHQQPIVHQQHPRYRPEPTFQPNQDFHQGPDFQQNPGYQQGWSYLHDPNAWGSPGAQHGAPPPGQPPPNLFPAPQRRRRILVAAVVALALIAGVATIVVAGYRDSREVAEQARAAKATTAPPPASYSASASEIAFEYLDSSGTVTVNSHEWRDSTLIVNVSVSVTEGELGFTFGGWGVEEDYAFAEDATPPSPALSADYLVAGESATGNIALEFEERGATTLRFNDTYHDPIAALPIP